MTTVATSNPGEPSFVPEQPTSTEPAYPYLTVQPDNTAEWGWTLMVRHPDGEPVAQSARYPSESDALVACDFAAGLVSAHSPLRFADWEPGWEYGHRPAGNDAITVRPMPVPAGWKLQAYRPDGDLEAESHLYPTHRAVDMAQGFLRSVNEAQPRRVRIDRACGCQQLGRRCHHFGGLTVPVPNPVSVSVRPNPRSTQGWELVTRDEDGAPLGYSPPYPTEAEALDARDFALRVVNSPHPIRFDGWKPWRGAQGVGHIPPNSGRSRCHSPDPPTHTTRHLAAASPPRHRDGHPHVASLPELRNGRRRSRLPGNLGCYGGRPGTGRAGEGHDAGHRPRMRLPDAGSALPPLRDRRHRRPRPRPGAVPRFLNQPAAYSSGEVLGR